MDSRTHMICQLKVDTQSGGWEKCLTKMLNKIHGANYRLDAEQGLLLVSGKVNPKKVLRKLKKAGKVAEILWVQTGGPMYYDDPTSPRSYYNNGYMNPCYRHGYRDNPHPTAPSYNSYHHHHHHQLPMNRNYPYAGSYRYGEY